MPEPDPSTRHQELPAGFVAARLLRVLEEDPGNPLVYVAANGPAARLLARTVQAMAPDLRLSVFPAWDCMPYDHLPPSHAVMGMRMGVLRWLLDEATPPDLVLTTAPALIRRVPPKTVWPSAHLEFRVGERLDLHAVQDDLRRLGYVIDDRVDEPGEAALRGQVIDLFPAAAPLPCRVEHREDRITEIRSYDPVSQRSEVETDLLTVDPASEVVAAPSGGGEAAGAGLELAMARCYPRMDTLFGYAEQSRILIGPAAERRAADFLAQVEEAYQSRLDFRGGDAEHLPPPDRLFLDAASWQDLLAQKRLVTPLLDPAQDPHVPRFIEESNASASFRRFLDENLRTRRVLLAAGVERPLRLLVQRAERATGTRPERAEDWKAVATAAPGTLLAMKLPLDRGFVDDAAGIAVVAAADLLGSRAGGGKAVGVTSSPLGVAELRIGDTVVHAEHGMAVLEGLEEVRLDGDAPADVLRLRYAGDKVQLTPVDEIGQIWRYGGGDAAVTLDRLDGSGWAERRARVEAEIEASAARLVAFADERQRRRAPKLTPPANGDYERFAARFPYALTDDQATAVDAVLADLASGRPMDRLVCGDVGFGKTEVALRAAAVAALAGMQVAVVAPTTVLARQHVRTFRRRFAPFGIEVAHLSRLVKPAEAREVKAGLASGAVRIVVGTHALAAKGVAFTDLGLVVIDEEQRFGIAHKNKLRALAEDCHVLTLTATPIPRTLQASLIGLQDLSVIATPPVMRQPTRTVLMPFEEGAVREALLRERRRGGQSFMVCPRIEDMEPLAERLRALVPDMEVKLAHGGMPAEEIDEAMVSFADGKGDILLATNVIESCLDVPLANTMLVWRPDRFGLAQLHQLRGRVGRGSRRASAYLLTDPAHPLPPRTEKRLRTLEALDRLGAGFAISARDLDLRGAGDLLGEEQAGHVTAIGLGLYQHLLERAMKTARGQPVEADWLPALHLGISGRIPPDYVPEPDMRIDLYVRAAMIESENDALEFAAELADRFGPVPDPMRNFLALARIRALCRRLGIRRLDAGPQGIAATFGDEAAGKAAEAAFEGWRWNGQRLVLGIAIMDPGERLEVIGTALEEAASRHRQKKHAVSGHAPQRREKAAAAS